MIRSGNMRKAFRRGANMQIIYRACTTAPGQLNAIPDANYVNTAITNARVISMSENIARSNFGNKDKQSAAGDYQDAERVVLFEGQSITGRELVDVGRNEIGDLINIGGSLDQQTNNLTGGIDFKILGSEFVAISGFSVMKLFLKAVV